MLLFNNKREFFVIMGALLRMRTVSELIGDEYLDWKPGIPYVLSSQTGRGKTTFVMTQLLKHAAAKNKDVRIVSRINFRLSF